jgi:hypothetical protein
MNAVIHVSRIGCQRAEHFAPPRGRFSRCSSRDQERPPNGEWFAHVHTESIRDVVVHGRMERKKADMRVVPDMHINTIPASTCSTILPDNPWADWVGRACSSDPENMETNVRRKRERNRRGEGLLWLIRQGIAAPLLKASSRI